MLPTPYQIIAPLVALIAILYAWNLVFRQKKTIWEATLWTLFWGAIVGIAIYPDVIDYLTVATGIQDRENAVLVTFLGILSFIVFYLVVRLEEMEQRLTRIVRMQALKDVRMDEKDRK